MRVWIMSLIALLSLQAWAEQDGNEGLYEMAAPADSAFVRVVNLFSDQADISMDDWTVSLAPGQAGDYLYRPAGTALIRINGREFHHDFAARSVHTLVFDGEAVRRYQDRYFNSRLKALLVMYNLTTQPASLQTGNGAVTIIGPLQPADTQDREINGVKVALRVMLDKDGAVALDDAVLERGRVYSVWVLPGEGAPLARLEEAHVATMP